MHPEAYDAVGRIAERLHIDTEPMASALDIGGANWNGHARDWFTVERWDVLDIETPSDVDPKIGMWYAGDARDWRHPHGKKYDLIIATEVFEHVQHWKRIFTTAATHLTQNGVFIFTCASDGRPVHGATGAPRPEPGEWYANVSPHSIEEIVGKVFKESHVEYNPIPGDAYGYGKGPW